MDATLKTQYETMEKLREPFIKRARKSASLTVPSVFPKEDLKGGDEYDQPWQSAGSRGLQNISNKIILSLYPPNTPFFRHKISEITKAEILTGGQSGDTEEGKRLLEQIEQGLASAEQIVVDDFESSNARPVMVEASQQLVVAGNVLLREEKNGDMRLWRLDSYVVKRSPLGDIRKIITREVIEMEDIPSMGEIKLSADQMNGKKEIVMFTILKFVKKGKRWESWQEVEKIEIPGSRSKFSNKANPWNALWMFPRSGLSYGDGFINTHLADLITLDSLTESIAEGSAAAAKLIFMVDPNSSVNPQDLADANNGDVIEGNASEVTTLQSQKAADLRVAKEFSDSVERRLAFVFLLNSTVQRKAERVTAEEIRFVAEELESALGGVYSTLARDWQMPFVQHRIHRLKRQGKFPPIDTKDVNIVIITGLDALGRGSELNKFRAFIADVGNYATIDPNVLRYLNTETAIRRLQVGHGINEKGLIKSKADVDREIQAEQQAAMQANMLAKLGDTGIEAGGEIVKAAAEANLAPA